MTLRPTALGHAAAVFEVISKQLVRMDAYLQSITRISDTPNVTLWTANDSNAAGQITQETLGNGVVTQRAYDAVTRQLATVQSGVGSGAALQNESYLYDLVGNVIQRQNNNQGLTESFCYDNLYRLDHSTLSGLCSGTPNLQMHYDVMGNITSRSDVANGTTWTYDIAKKHAVTQAGTGGPSYGYDANGNANSRNGFAIDWTSYNKPSSISGSGESVQFSYDHNYEHWRATYTQGGVTETTYFIGDLMEKVVGVGGAIDYRHFVYAGGEKVAIDSRTQAGVNTLRYVLEDHQGSVAAFLNASGQCEVKESFTAFGARRNSCTWSGVPTSGSLNRINAVTRHGYTWQTALGAMGLNDMHGRVQDAVTGRFLSADPFVSEPMLTQSFNRYSYVYNNPLSYTDPSGFIQIPGCVENCDFPIWCDFGLCSVDPGFMDLFGDHWGFTEFPGVAHEQYLHIYVGQPDFRALWTAVSNTLYCGQSCMKSLTKAPNRFEGVDGQHTQALLQRIKNWYNRTDPRYDANGLTARDQLEMQRFYAYATGSVVYTSSEEVVRVGRIMSPKELAAMRESGLLQESWNGGVTSVSLPANAGTYRAGPKGDVYVEFNVPASAIGAADGSTAKIYGPSSLQGRYLGITRMPPVTEIIVP